GEEALREAVRVFVVRAEAGEATNDRAGADLTRLARAVTGEVARMRITAEGPLRRAGGELGDHDLDAVGVGEVHHAVVVGPIVFAGSDFDGAPQEPVAEG